MFEFGPTGDVFFFNYEMCLKDMILKGIYIAHILVVCRFLFIKIIIIKITLSDLSRILGILLARSSAAPPL